VLRPVPWVYSSKNNRPALNKSMHKERTEEHQQDREALLASIVDSADDAIISTTLDGTILSWNKGAERLYGYTASEAEGRPLPILPPADHPDEVTRILAGVGRGERIEHYETVCVRKDGERIKVTLTISPIKDTT